MYAGNIIPQSHLSPHAQRVLQYIPLPNQPGMAANLVAGATDTVKTNQILGRFDQNLGNKVRLYVRYNWRDELSTGLGAIPVNSTDTPQTDHNTLVAYTHTLTSNLVNDFRIGHHSVEQGNLGYFLNNNLLDAGANLGIPGFDGDVRYNNPGLPIFSITGFSGVQSGNANWTQGDYHVPDVQRARVHPGIAQHPDRVRSAEAGDRARHVQRTPRDVHLQRPDDRLRARRFHARDCRGR